MNICYHSKCEAWCEKSGDLQSWSLHMWGEGQTVWVGRRKVWISTVNFSDREVLQKLWLSMYWNQWSVQVMNYCAHFAYCGFVWALLSSSRYMQFNIAGLQRKWKVGKQTVSAPGVAADVNYQMPGVLEGIYRVKIEEWRGLVLDWMPLSRLPDEVCALHIGFDLKLIWHKTQDTRRPV